MEYRCKKCNKIIIYTRKDKNAFFKIRFCDNKKTYYFCDNKCKKKWILERLAEKNLLDDEELLTVKIKINEISELYNQFGARHGKYGFRWKKGNPQTFLVNTHLPNRDLDWIEFFILCGLYMNRAEALRYYVKKGIQEDLKDIRKIEFR